MAFFLGWLGCPFYLQAGLESTGHDLVVGPGAAEHQQVDIEEQQVHEDGDDQQGHRSGEQVTEHTDLPEREGTSPLLWGRRAQVCPAPRPVIRRSLPPRPPRVSLALPRTSAPTFDSVWSPIRCQAWTAATPSTSKYVNTPTYLMLKGHNREKVKTRQARRTWLLPQPRGANSPDCTGAGHTRQYQPKPPARREGPGAKHRSRAGRSECPPKAREGTLLRDLGVSWLHQAPGTRK